MAPSPVTSLFDVALRGDLVTDPRFGAQLVAALAREEVLTRSGCSGERLTAALHQVLVLHGPGVVDTGTGTRLVCQRCAVARELEDFPCATAHAALGALRATYPSGPTRGD